jgi:hypothetical protein
MMQIWRPETNPEKIKKPCPLCEHYTLVGENRVIVDVGGLQRIDVAPGRQLTAKRGDVIGWRHDKPGIIPYDYNGVPGRVMFNFLDSAILDGLYLSLHIFLNYIFTLFLSFSPAFKCLQRTHEPTIFDVHCTGNWTHCAIESEDCQCEGWVRFGKATTTGPKWSESQLQCSTTVFGNLQPDPKECDCMPMKKDDPPDPPAIGDTFKFAPLDNRTYSVNVSHNVFFLSFFFRIVVNASSYRISGDHGDR